VQHLNIIEEAMTLKNSADLDDLPPAITPRSTRAQRKFAHVAKMAGKRYNRENGIVRGESPKLRSRNHARRLTGYTSIAKHNRHTGKPHEHAREIMRRTMTPFQRRAFAHAVALQLAEGTRD
jgi:hypothetical protein